MAREHGSKAHVKYGPAASETDISQYVTSISQSREGDLADVSGLGDTDRKWVAGLKAGTYSMEGNFDPTLDALLDAGIAVEKSIIYGPQGSTSGKVKYTATVILGNYEVQTDLGDAGKWSCEVTVTGAVTRGTF